MAGTVHQVESDQTITIKYIYIYINHKVAYVCQIYTNTLKVRMCIYVVKLGKRTVVIIQRILMPTSEGT